jgi:hypothetical protein
MVAATLSALIAANADEPSAITDERRVTEGANDTPERATEVAEPSRRAL